MKAGDPGSGSTEVNVSTLFGCLRWNFGGPGSNVMWEVKKNHNRYRHERGSSWKGKKELGNIIFEDSRDSSMFEGS